MAGSERVADEATALWTGPPSAAAAAGGTAADEALRRVLLHGVLVALTAAVFAADVAMHGESVSVCFAYAGPIVLGALVDARTPFAYAAAASVLAVAGLAIQPGEATTAAFVVNRALAVGALWLLALLMHSRHRAEAALRRSLEMERAKADMQRRLIAILSHEVKTPLTTIDGQAYRLGKLSRTLEPDDVVVRTAKIRAAVRRISGIVERIELSSAAGSGEAVAAIEPVDLADLLVEAAQTHAERPGAPAFAFDLGRLPVAASGDPSLLLQVFDNLLSNAVKYTPPGGTVTVEGRAEEGHAVVSVSDDGAGIDPQEAPSLFKPYFRGRNSGGVGGAGIGLYLVERYVALHGGRVAVANRPGGGAVFTVRLPLTPTTTDPVHHVAPQ
ncbi:sensor histidine kinase [Azospirillum halopraeferens]|uniref:sensor histidine kinase n=1 Tax=Azospirillum halopraeferens TaxID=34010 RepID=UPI00040C55FF|nr:HAMP domain-containing sensor histidine kinase [Azospirillum halopraeferens]